jgi:iron(III) transport system permease protein
VATTLVLLGAVLAGVIAVGVRRAWCVTAFEFPGRRVLEWALLLPLAVPAYVMAYAYTDWLQFSGPVQTWLRERWAGSAATTGFPRSARGWRGGDVRLRALSLRVPLARVAFLEQSPSLTRPAARSGSRRARVLPREPADGAPAIAAGAALALMETLADFGTVSYFGVQTFTTGSSARGSRWASPSRRRSSR